jgi:AcrR family transcriptional regulator
MSAFEPSETDRRRVMMLVVCGIARDRIAEHLGISKPTLYRHFADELDNGNDIANAAVAGSLYQNAVDGTVSAQIFWMKTIARWSDKDMGDAGLAPTMEAEAEETAVSDREVARRIAFVLDRAARTEDTEPT